MKTSDKLLNLLRTAVLLIAGILMSNKSSAQEEFTFAATWSPGDTFAFKITNSIEKWVGNDLVEDDTSFFYADLIILDSTEHGYRVRWDYINDLTSFGIAADQWDDFYDFEYQEVICQTDASGAMVQIENLEELRQETLAIVEASLKQKVDAKEIDFDHYQKTLEGFKNLYAGDSGSRLLEDDFIMMVHNCFGKSFFPPQSIRSEVVTANPFGGDPISMDTESLVETPDQNKQIRMIAKSQLSDDSMQSLMISVLKKFGMEDSELESELANMRCRMDKKSICDFDCELTMATNIITTEETIFKTTDYAIEKYAIDRIELVSYLPNLSQ